MRRRDLGELVGHARAARDAGDHALGALQDALQHTLGAAHFPKDIDVDRARAAGDLERLAHLLHGAFDRIGDQLFMARGARLAEIELGNEIAVDVIAVRIDGGDGADAAGGGPGAGAGMIGHGDALAALDQRPHLTTAIDDRLNALEQSKLLRSRPAGFPGPRKARPLATFASQCA